MKLFKKIAALVLGAVTGFAAAQGPVTHTYPALDTNNVFTGVNSFANINNIYVVGVAPYLTVEEAVNAACSVTDPGTAEILLGPTYSSYDDLSVLGGCSRAYLSDQRSANFVNYTWNGTAYVAVSTSVFPVCENGPYLFFADQEGGAVCSLGVGASNSGGLFITAANDSGTIFAVQGLGPLSDLADFGSYNHVGRVSISSYGGISINTSGGSGVVLSGTTDAALSGALVLSLSANAVQPTWGNKSLFFYVDGNGNLFSQGNATFAGLASSAGDCLQIGTGGTLVPASAACGTGGGGGPSSPFNGQYIASLSPNASSNLALRTLVNTGACSTIACFIQLDNNYLDQEPVDTTANNYPDGTSIIDNRSGGYQTYTHNAVGPYGQYVSISKDQSFAGVHNDAQVDAYVSSNPGNNNGYAGGPGLDTAPYIFARKESIISVHTSGIYDGDGEQGVIMMGAGDRNLREDDYVGASLNWNGGGDEGLHNHSLHLNYVPPMTGFVATSTNSGTMTFSGVTYGSYVAPDSPLIDTTYDILSGNVTYSSSSGIPGTGAPGSELGQLTTVTADFTVPVSVVGYMPAEICFQGICVIATNQETTAYSSYLAIVASAQADASAITVAGNSVSIAYKDGSGTIRTQAQLVNLINTYSPAPTAAGRLYAFLQNGNPGSTPLVVTGGLGLGPIVVPEGTGPYLTNFGVSNPTLNGSSVAMPTGALMVPGGTNSYEAFVPTCTQIGTSAFYGCSALMYKDHAPSVFYSNQSSSPSTGTANRMIEFTGITALSGKRYVEYVFGSPTANSLVVGVPVQGAIKSLDIQSTTGVSRAVTIFHGATVRTVIDPATTQHLQDQYAGVKGTFLQTDAIDPGSFAVGTQVMDLPAEPQNYGIENYFIDVEDPNANFSMETTQLFGDGTANGPIHNIVNNVPTAHYADLNPWIAVAGSGIYAYSISGSSVGTFYYNYSPPFTGKMVAGQSVLLNGFTISTFLNSQTANIATVGATTTAFTGTIVTSSHNTTITGVSTTSGYVVGNPVSCTVSGAPGLLANSVVTSISGSTVTVSSVGGVAGAGSCTASSPYFTLPLTGVSTTALTSEAGVINVPNLGPGRGAYLNFVGPPGYSRTLTFLAPGLEHYNGAAYWPVSQKFYNLTNLPVYGGFNGMCNPQETPDSYQITGSAGAYVLTLRSAAGVFDSNSQCAYVPGFPIELYGFSYAPLNSNSSIGPGVLTSATPNTLVIALPTAYTGTTASLTTVSAGVVSNPYWTILPGAFEAKYLQVSGSQVCTAANSATLSGCGGTSSPTFATLGSGNNTTSTMTVGGTASLATLHSSGGTVIANGFGDSTNAVIETINVPTAGQVPTATSGTSWTWATPSSGGGSGTVGSGTTGSLAGYLANGTVVNPFTPAQIEAAIGVQLYYVDTFPSTCTVATVAYTTKADCAYFTALNYTTTNYISTELIFGSGNYLKNATWTEPTANPARFAVSLVGAGYQATMITQNTSTPSAPMLKKAEPSVNEDFAGLRIQGITWNAQNNANSCMDLFGLNQANIEDLNCIGVIVGSNHYYEFGEPGQPSAGGGDDNYIHHVIASSAAPGWSTPPVVVANVVSGQITSYTVSSFTAGYPNGTPMTCKVVGFGHGNVPGTTQPTCAASISGGTLSVTPVAVGAGVTGTVDVQVYPTTGATYGIIYALSDGTMSQTFTNVGDTCGFEIYGGANTFYHLHPTDTVCGVIDVPGVYSSGQENLYDGTELDTIAQFGMIFQSFGGNIVRGTHAIVQNSYPGLVDFYIQSTAGNVAIEDGVTLGDGTLPVDSHPLMANNSSYGAGIIYSTTTYLLPYNFRWVHDPGYGGLGFDYDSYQIPTYSFKIPHNEAGEFMGVSDQRGITSDGTAIAKLGTALASASTIAPTSPVTHVTGAVGVSTITPTTGCGYSTGYTCRLTLISDGGFSLLSGGNIGITTAIATVIGNSYDFNYDQATSLWYPVATSIPAGVVVNSPSTSQAIAQPTGTTLGVNNFNNVVEATSGTIETAVAGCNAVYPCEIVVSGTLTQSTVGTYSLPAGVSIRVEAGGSLTRTGTNVLSFLNTPGVVQSPPVNIGFGTGGGVTGLYGCYANWFGTVADGGLVLGGSGTDNTAALQAGINSLIGGDMLVLPGNYTFTGGLSITTNNIGIIGVANSTPNHGSGTIAFLLKSATAYGIGLNGTSGTLLFGVRLKNFTVQRVIAPTGTAVTTAGIYMTYANGAELQGVISRDSINGFYCLGCGMNNKGYFRNLDFDWGFTIIPTTSYSGLTMYGLNVDSTGSVQNATFIAEDMGGGGSTSGTSTGYYLHGSSINDFYCVRCQDSLSTYGAQVASTSTGATVYQNGDVHFLQPVFDAWTSEGIKITGLTGSSSPYIGSLDIVGGYIRSYQSSSSAGCAIDIQNSNGVSVTGVQLVANGTTRNIVCATTAYDLTFTGNVLQEPAVDAFKLTGVTYSTFTGNVIDQTMSGGVFNLATTSTNNTIIGNTVHNANTFYVGDGTSGIALNNLSANVGVTAPANNSTAPLSAPGYLPTIIYSAAGTALPTCAVGIKGQTSVVSDATTPTYMGAYASGGAITAPVVCSYNGTTYSWLTY